MLRKQSKNFFATLEHPLKLSTMAKLMITRITQKLMAIGEAEPIV
jgi:hypothetical protein